MTPPSEIDRFTIKITQFQSVPNTCVFCIVIEFKLVVISIMQA